jgi:hypothetical protein
MDEHADESLADSSMMDKPWRIVAESPRPYAAVEYADAVRIAEAIAFVEEAALKVLDLIRSGNTPMAVQGVQQVRLVLGHWASEATALAVRLEMAQAREDRIDEATEG